MNNNKYQNYLSKISHKRKMIKISWMFKNLKIIIDQIIHIQNREEIDIWNKKKQQLMSLPNNNRMNRIQGIFQKNLKKEKMRILRKEIKIIWILRNLKIIIIIDKIIFKQSREEIDTCHKKKQ